MFANIASRKNVIIHDNTVIGADGFGFITKDGKHTKVPTSR